MGHALTSPLRELPLYGHAATVVAFRLTLTPSSRPPAEPMSRENGKKVLEWI